VNKRLLIIDDEETILFAFQKYFHHRHGYSVQCARELEEAEALVVCGSFDLVIVDLSLSGKGSYEGLEFLRFVRQHSPEARVILLTAFATPAIENEAKRRGAHALLKKPRPLAEIARIADELFRGAA